MHGGGASTGWRLGSVALRYRQPICARGRLRADPARSCRLPLPGEQGFGPSRPGLIRLGWWRGAGALARAAEGLPGGDGSTARPPAIARLEAVLFVARHPQSTRKLAELAGLADGTEARTLVRRLNRLYDAEGSAFRVEEVAGGLQLLSRSQFAPWLIRLHDVPVEVRLSAPAMETLAVVAYRQPVLRAEIEAIRGVQCGEILRQLIERDLVRIVGRSEELGRPFLYGTTRQFLQVFGLRHLDELPRRELFQATQTVPAGAPGADGAEADQQISHQTNHPDQVEEETKVNTAATADVHPEALPDDNAATVPQTPRNEQPDEEYTFDDYEDEDYSDDEDECDEDEYDEEDEDEFEDDEDDEDDEDEFEDEPWEEVEDEDEEDDEDDEEYDDEDWEDEDDDDWDDDDWEEEDEEEDED